MGTPGRPRAPIVLGPKTHDNRGLRLSYGPWGQPSSGLGTADWSVSNTMRAPSRVCRRSACSSVSGRAARSVRPLCCYRFPVSTALKGGTRVSKNDSICGLDAPTARQLMRAYWAERPVEVACSVLGAD
jgi:hypothetical protein